MYITCIILEKHFSISIAPVQSRGGSLVFYKGMMGLRCTYRTFNQKRMQIKMTCKEKSSLKVLDQEVLFPVYFELLHSFIK
jgi:hypothetical protein